MHAGRLGCLKVRRDVAAEGVGGKVSDVIVGVRQILTNATRDDSRNAGDVPSQTHIPYVSFRRDGTCTFC